MEDELIKIWQSSPEIEQIKFEKSRLMLDLENSLNRFHRLIKYSVLAEQIAIIIIIPVFSFYIYWVPHLLSKIASFLLVLWAIWYMFRLRKVKKRKPKSVTLSYLEYLKKNKGYMKYLKNMTDTAVYWYLILPLSGYFLFIAGPYFDGVIDNAFLVILVLIGLATGVAYYLYFRWAIKNIYNPRLKKIDELIEVMEE